jgi:hypothetical protein
MKVCPKRCAQDPSPVAHLSLSLRVNGTRSKISLSQENSTAAIIASAGFQEPDAMELADDGRHISGRCTGSDIKRHGELISDFRHRELTVTPVPDVPGGVVEVMNQAGPTIEHHTFTVNQAKADIRPPLRAMGIDAHLRTGGTTGARLRRRVHPTINAWCLRYTVT